MTGNPYNDASFSELLEILRKRPRSPNQIRFAMLAPEFPATQLRIMAESDDPFDRRLAADCSRTPLDMLAKLGRDDDESVRSAAATNEAMTPLLATQLWHEGYFTWEQAYGVPNAPPEVVGRALIHASAHSEIRDFLWRSRYGAATPPGSLEQWERALGSWDRYPAPEWGETFREFEERAERSGALPPQTSDGASPD